MRTTILTLCDFAKEYNGQLSITGTFNQIRSSVFPTEPLTFFIAMQFFLKENIIGDHIVSLTVKNNATGLDLLKPQEFKLNVAPSESGNLDEALITNLILNLEKVSFKEPGSFNIKVVSDGNLQELDFFVVKV